MKQSITTFAKNFIKCGLTGWCLEIIFTAVGALRRRDMSLTGNTSLWMFPIYGCAAIFSPISRKLSGKPTWFRGFTYTCLIFLAEYSTGQMLTKHKSCPWNYRRNRWNVGRVIRLDYAPFWFVTGLLFERLLGTTHKCPAQSQDPTSS